MRFGYGIAKKIGYADALHHLEAMARNLGGDGLGFWDKLLEQVDSEQGPEQDAGPDG